MPKWKNDKNRIAKLAELGAYDQIKDDGTVSSQILIGGAWDNWKATTAQKHRGEIRLYPEQRNSYIYNYRYRVAGTPERLTVLGNERSIDFMAEGDVFTRETIYLGRGSDELMRAYEADKEAGKTKSKDKATLKSSPYTNPANADALWEIISAYKEKKKTGGRANFLSKYNEIYIYNNNDENKAKALDVSKWVKENEPKFRTVLMPTKMPTKMAASTTPAENRGVPVISNNNDSYAYAILWLDSKKAEFGGMSATQLIENFRSRRVMSPKARGTGALKRNPRQPRQSVRQTPKPNIPPRRKLNAPNTSGFGTAAKAARKGKGVDTDVEVGGQGSGKLKVPKATTQSTRRKVDIGGR